MKATVSRSFSYWLAVLQEKSTHGIFHGPFISGTVSTHQKNSITIEDAEINGVATRALVYPTTYCEKGSEVLYNMLECAALGETIRFSMDVYWDGKQKNSHWHTFLHVGPAGYGITLGMNGYGQLSFANQNNYEEDLIESSNMHSSSSPAQEHGRQ